MTFAGVEWAMAHNDVYVQGQDGTQLAGGRLPEGSKDWFHAMSGGCADEPTEVVIGIESLRGLLPCESQITQKPRDTVTTASDGFAVHLFYTLWAQLTSKFSWCARVI